jgi:hypothetical protein
MVEGFLERVPYLAVALIVFVVMALAGMAVRAGMRAVAQRNRPHFNLGLALGRLGQGLIVFLGLLIALVITIPGFTAGELISILGLSSVAIGFAFRDILQNFLAGIPSEPFRIGDKIVLVDFEGTVALRDRGQPARAGLARRSGGGPARRPDQRRLRAGHAADAGPGRRVLGCGGWICRVLHGT